MDSDAGALWGAVILFLLLLLDFVLTSFLSALNTVSASELEEAFEEAGRPPDEVMELREHRGKLTHTIWLINALICTMAGFLFKELERAVPAYVVFPVLAVVFYLFANSVPEMLGRRNAARVLLRRYGFVHRVMLVVSPVTFVMTAVSNGCVRIFGVDPQSLANEVTEDEIISMVNEGHEQGVLDAREAEMIQNIFELDDKKAADIMTHRKNIIAINGSTNLRDAISFMVGETVSRFPVYGESIDNVLGLLHFKDAMKFHTAGSYDDWLIRDIPQLLRPVRFIPETRGISRLFRTMQAEKLQMVLVADEYGQTSGLVAMEDILEEIVGNIQDEYDNDVQFIRRDAGGGYLMDGMAPLEEVAGALSVTFEDAEYDTLNGLLISRLDRIPSDGEQAEVRENGYLFQILKVENKIIRLVKITKYEEEKE